MTTILITGAGGNIGRELVPLLAGTPGVTVRALVRSPDKLAPLEELGVSAVLGDLDDPRSLGAAFEGVERLWLLTALGPRAPEHSMNALWAARQAGVRHVVRMSAIGAAHDAPTRNGRLHALSDAELMASGFGWTILKPHFFMQNLLGQFELAKSQGALYLDLGTERLGLIDVKDVARFGARVLLAPEPHRGKTYTLTGPASISMHDAARDLGHALGRTVTYVPVSHDQARTAYLELGTPAWLADAFVEYGVAYEGGWGNYTTPDFASVTGKSATSFAEFARQNLV